ncbi:MAG: hypothetical protein IJS78_04030 [Clostridia bacterium]|nr:hypothetical protein [Clostridia bacterium]
MFGYVRPDIPELKVREYDAYRAVYCGICKSAGGALGRLARLELSYDAVFLALVRMLASGTAPDIRDGRCAFHPMKKRPVCADCGELRYAAVVTALLTDAKIRDDMRDERGLKRLRARLLSPFSSSIAKRALKKGGGDASAVREAIDSALSRLSELEAARSPSLDDAAERFGELTAAVFSAGFDGDRKRILDEAGRATGRFIYAADAADDARDDLVSGSYNPIVLTYGDAAFDPPDKKGVKPRLKKSVGEAILRGAMLDLGRLPPAVGLLCDGGDPTVAAIVENIVYSGMPGTMNRVVSVAAGAKSRRHKGVDPVE